MPLSPEERKLVGRRLKALDAQPAVQKLLQEVRAERLQRQALSRPYPPAEERWLGLEELEGRPLSSEN